MNTPWGLLFTGRNEVVAKVMFLHVCVILFTGGVSGQTPLGPGRHPPGPGRHPPGPGRENPPRPGRPPPGPGRQPPSVEGRLQHTVNERPVRILLECILFFVFHFFWSNLTLNGNLVSTSTVTNVSCRCQYDSKFNTKIIQF